MTVLWDKIKKNLIESLNLAIDKTEELTSVGRIKLEILQLEHRLDEKHAELGRIIYDHLSDDTSLIQVDEQVKQLREEIQDLRNKLNQKEAELGRIKKEDGIDFDS
ncbi:MAG: hypothetical protein Kow0042_12120 [Calditrichia bacterium]